MKRTVLIVCVSLFVLQMSAQLNEPGRFYITPKAGYNMANITLLDKYGVDSRHAIHVGISAEYAFNEMISIEPGLFYSMQGSAFKIGNVKFGLNSDYVTFPVLLKVYITDGFNLFAGPQLGYLVSSRIKVKTGMNLLDDILGIVSKNIDLKKHENELDFAIVLGLGYQFAKGLSISANYNFGLTDVTKMGDITIGKESYNLNPDAKNRVLQVSLGYRF